MIFLPSDDNSDGAWDQRDKHHRLTRFCDVCSLSIVSRIDNKDVIQYFIWHFYTFPPAVSCFFMKLFASDGRHFAYDVIEWAEYRGQDAMLPFDCRYKMLCFKCFHVV